MNRVSVFLILACIIFSSGAKEKQTINWIEVNYPPAYILDGEMKDKGFAQVPLNIFMSKIKNYSHSKTAMNINRMMQLFKSKKQIYCSPALGVKVNQFPDTLYSNVVVIAPPAGIVIRKKDLNKFKNNNGVSVERLIKETTYRLGIIDRGLFGSRLDSLIFKKYHNNPNIYKRAEVDQKTFYQMLLGNRVDYIIDYAFSYHTISNEKDSNFKKTLQFLPIVEGDLSQKGHAMCNTHPSSQTIIKMINEIIKAKTYRDSATNQLLQFLPAHMRDQYRMKNLLQIGK